MRRGQSTLDYILLIGVVAAGLIAMLVYIGRGHQGNLRSQADQLGAGQYVPGKTTISNSENKTLTSTASAGSATTVVHGNLNEPNTALGPVLTNIVNISSNIYSLKQTWELLAVGEAQVGAAAVRGGNFNWSPPGNGLHQIDTGLTLAGNALKTLNTSADLLEKNWSAHRTKDQTTGTTSYSSETGTVGDRKHTSETLGNL